MIIQIKKTHIRRGHQNTVDSCPIALAIRESLSVQNVDVQKRTVRIGKTMFTLPVEAQNFIRAFDERKSSVGPLAFEL